MNQWIQWLQSFGAVLPVVVPADYCQSWRTQVDNVLPYFFSIGFCHFSLPGTTQLLSFFVPHSFFLLLLSFPFNSGLIVILWPKLSLLTVFRAKGKVIGIIFQAFGLSCAILHRMWTRGLIFSFCFPILLSGFSGWSVTSSCIVVSVHIGYSGIIVAIIIIRYRLQVVSW